MQSRLLLNYFISDSEISGSNKIPVPQSDTQHVHFRRKRKLVPTSRQVSSPEASSLNQTSLYISLIFIFPSGPCRSLAVVSCLYESGLFLRRGRFVKNRLMKSDVSGEAGGSELKPDGKHLIQDDGICSWINCCGYFEKEPTRRRQEEEDEEEDDARLSMRLEVTPGRMWFLHCKKYSLKGAHIQIHNFHFSYDCKRFTCSQPRTIQGAWSKWRSEFRRLLAIKLTNEWSMFEYKRRFDFFLRKMSNEHSRAGIKAFWET